MRFRLVRPNGRPSRHPPRRGASRCRASAARGLAAACALFAVAPPTFAADAAVEVVPRATRRAPSHGIAYAALAGGAGLIGASFAFSHRANRAYDRYLAASTPEEIEREFDLAVHHDRWSSGTLLAGEVLVAVGLYLRFLRAPAGERLSIAAGPERCALTFRF